MIAPRMGRRARSVLIVGVPLVVAAAAVALYPFWVLGIPGTPDAPYAQGWTIGYMALSLYLPAYALCVGVLIVLRLLKWPLARPVHWLIWLCMAAFLVAMGVALLRLA